MARNEELIAAVVKLQASVRGFMVRKKFSELRAEYVDLVAFLEKNKDVQVTWKTNKPCLPSVNYKRPGVRKIRERVSSGVDNRSENQEIDDVSLGCRRTSQSSPFTTERERGKFEEVFEVKEVCRVADTNFEVKQNIKEMQVPNYRLESQKNSQTDNPNDDITADVCTSVGNGNKDNVLDQQDGLPVRQTNQQLIEGNVLNQEIKENMNSQGVKTRGFQAMFGVSVNMYPKGRTALIKLREDLMMELLWTQQAIDSRKKTSSGN